MNLDFNMEVKIKGRYKIRKLVEGEVIYESDWFENLITNAGLDMIGGLHGVPTTTPLATFCYVGTGTTTPSVTDTTLTTYLAETNSVSSGTQSFVSGSPSYYTNTFTYTFATGTATGILSEVGVGFTTNTVGPVYTLFSHALIVTAGNVPTTITVLSNESLQVLYQLQLYNNVTTNTYSVVIAGVTYSGSYLGADFGNRGAGSNAYTVFSSMNVTGVLPLFAVYNGTIGVVTALPTGSSDSMFNNRVSGSVTSGTYTSGTYTQSYTVTFGTAFGNLAGGITAISIDFAIGCYQFSVSPAIPKDSNHILTMTFSISWASGI